MSSLIKMIQEVNLSQYYVKKTLEGLKKITTYLNDINQQYNLINKKIKEIFTFPQDISEQFKNMVNDYFEWFNNYQESHKTNKEKYIKDFNTYYSDLIDIFKKYYEKISLSYTNQMIIRISEFNENIKEIIGDIKEFDPPSINNESDNKIIFDPTIEDSLDSHFYDSDPNGKSQDFYGSILNDSLKDDRNESSLKCYIHSNEKGLYYCSHCDFIFCQKCYEKITKKIEEINHRLAIIDDIKKEKEEEKNKFLKSFMNLFKDYLTKCNYIIYNKNSDFMTDQMIIKKFQYPILRNGNENNIDYQKQFLEEINILYKNLEEKKDSSITSINNSQINQVVSKFLKNELNLDIGDDYFNDDFMEDEKFTIDNEEYDEIIVHLIKKDNYNADDDEFNKDIIEKISKALSINPANVTIFPNNKREFINNFIKDELFSKISLKGIRKKFPNLPKLYEFKLLIDGLIRYECQIPENKLDYKFNFITPNLSLNNKRGSEIYIPPYGWFGIGLNVLNKYNNNDWLNETGSKSKWANCYYFFGKNLSSEEIIKIFKDIITNNVLYKDEKFQIKMNVFNKRKKSDKLQRIGIGYYLSNDINVAEKYTGVISFGKQRYKILLMAKVLIESIKEPEDKSFWIIPKNEDIRIYKILLKEFYH